jgi:hypothetical protein
MRKMLEKRFVKAGGGRRRMPLIIGPDVAAGAADKRALHSIAYL